MYRHGLYLYLADDTGAGVEIELDNSCHIGK